MNKFTIFLILAFALSSCKQAQKNDTMQAPDVKKVPKELTIHGDTRIDNYYWLRQRENPDVIAYLEAENAYTDSMLAHTKDFQQELYDEIVGRIKQNDESVPYQKNGYWYYRRFEEGKQYPVYCRKKGSLDAQEEILLNVNQMAEGFAYYHVAGLSVSPDNKLLAFGEDTVSRRKYTIYVKNLETGQIMPQTVPNTTGQAVWANDNKTLFYSKKDTVTLRPDRIFSHKIDQNAQNDKLVFRENDETFNCYVFKSKSQKYLLIASLSTLSTEYRLLNADMPDKEFQVFQPRERNHEYHIDHFADRFYVRTNLDAQNFRLMKTPENKTPKQNWQEVIPHRDSVLLEGFELFENYMVLDERKNGLTQLRVKSMSSHEDFYVDFQEETYTVWIDQNPEFETQTLRFGYSSLTTPQTIFDYNMQTRQRTQLKQDEVLGDFDPENYQSERLYATAKDGAKVPVSLVYKKGLQKNGKNPLVLYGYGSYGNSIDPYFRSSRFSLIDRGFVFAIAHIRGGQEMGRQWYEDGKLLKKKNTFTDFIACSEYLIQQNFTNPEKLFAVGGSAGGLLVGAVVNMRPELYKGVVAAVPFVDVVTTMLDESIPLTTGEFDEWGNPKEKEYYQYMLSYSPYDNVKEQNYPNLLVTTGLHDSQVQYWEPAKWVAKLRDKKTDNNMLLLKTNMKYGHSGASGRFERYKEIALEYAFMLNLVGINN